MQVDEKKRFRCFVLSPTGGLGSPNINVFPTLEEAQVAVESYLLSAPFQHKPAPVGVLVVLDLQLEHAYWAKPADARPRLQWVRGVV